MLLALGLSAVSPTVGLAGGGGTTQKSGREKENGLHDGRATDPAAEEEQTHNKEVAKQGLESASAHVKTTTENIGDAAGQIIDGEPAGMPSHGEGKYRPRQASKP